MLETNDAVRSRCVTDSVTPNLSEWNRIKQDVMAFEREHFGENFGEEELEYAFNSPDSTIVILRDTSTGRVVGFSYAESVEKAYSESFHPERDKLPQTAYIQNTAIHPDYIGHGLIGPLSQRMEEELLLKGFLFKEFDAVEKRNHALNIAKTFEGRVVFAKPHDSRWGPQVFFRVRLPEKQTAH